MERRKAAKERKHCKERGNREIVVYRKGIVIKVIESRGKERR